MYTLFYSINSSLDISTGDCAASAIGAARASRPLGARTALGLIRVLDYPYVSALEAAGARSHARSHSLTPPEKLVTCGLHEPSDHSSS